MEELYDLFPLEQADITEKGLMYHEILYSCSIAIREQWYLQTGVATKKIKIFVDRYDSDYILVLLNDGSLTIDYRIVGNSTMNEQSVKSYQETIRSLKEQLKTRKREENEEQYFSKNKITHSTYNFRSRKYFWLSIQIVYKELFSGNFLVE